MQSDSNPQKTSWYILKTKSNHEKKVFNQLMDKDFQAFLPLYETIRLWSDRKKKVEIPLIPTYVFVKCAESELIKAAQTTGVAWIMRDTRNYAIVREHEIQNLRIFLSEKFDNQSIDLDKYETGEIVKVTHGPFQGMIGTAMHLQSEYRVRIEISSLGANFTVSVPKSQLEKVTN
ncbi:MAG: UpxY family transcription antiterminator [Crocinitomicaceae bacterium]